LIELVVKYYGVHSSMTCDLSVLVAPLKWAQTMGTVSSWTWANC